MLRIQWLIRICALALPLLLLAQCTPQTSPPAAVLGQQKPPCLDYGDPARTFDVVNPLPGPVCTGLCGRVQINVQNACGPYTMFVEGWYDGVYKQVGFVKNESALHWDTPLGEHALATATQDVRLRVTVIDDLGLIAQREVLLSPVVGPRHEPVERD